MEFEFHIYPEERLIVERFYGEVDLDAVFETMRILEADPQYDFAYDGIVDLREATMKMSFNDMLTLNDYNRRRNARALGKWAYIAGKPVNEGTIRMYERVGGSRYEAIMSFFSEEEAREWLKSKNGQKSKSASLQ